MKVELSIVVPIFNEELLLQELVSRLVSTLEKVGMRWEIIFVNDASHDRSFELLLARARLDPRLKIVDLSRNFGHQMAITAGLYRASGLCCVIMDGDLQDPPEIIPELTASWKEGNEVVVAVRRSRAEKGPRRVAFAAFYKVIQMLSDINLTNNAGVFCLLDAKLVRLLREFPEHNRYLPGLRSWLGYRQSVVYYDRAARVAGSPKQTLVRLTRYALDAVFSFSYKPLRLASLAGVVIWVLTGVYAFVLLVARLLEINVVPGFTTTSIAVLLLGGLQLLCLGILGEYLARIYDEAKRRPLFVEREFVDLTRE